MAFRLVRAMTIKSLFRNTFNLQNFFGSTYKTASKLGDVKMTNKSPDAKNSEFKGIIITFDTVSTSLGSNTKTDWYAKIQFKF